MRDLLERYGKEYRFMLYFLTFYRYLHPFTYFSNLLHPYNSPNKDPIHILGY